MKKLIIAMALCIALVGLMVSPVMAAGPKLTFNASLADTRGNTTTTYH